MQRIKAFATPHKSHKINIAQILDVMRITGRDIHHFEPIARNRILQHFRLANLPQTDNALARNDEEFLVLCVMPVIVTVKNRRITIDVVLEYVQVIG